MARFLLLLVAVLMGGCAIAPEPTRVQRDELAPTGTMRVAVFTGNPVIGSADVLYGEPRGTTAVLARELAGQAFVKLQLIEYTAVAKMMEDLKTGAWDLAVLAYDPARRGVLEFAPPHLVVGDRGAATELCLVLPKGRTAARDYVAGFVLRAKSQGVVARAIEQSGLRGVNVAP